MRDVELSALQQTPSMPRRICGMMVRATGAIRSPLNVMQEGDTVLKVEVEPGVSLAYEDRGSGHAIIFLHDWAASGDVWDGQVLDFKGDHRCITLDLRGHGASDKPDGFYTYELFRRDLRSFIAQLDLGFEHEVTLVGCGMGGAIALNYVAFFEDGPRVRRLVLTGSGPRFVQAVNAPYGPSPAEIDQFIYGVFFNRTETIDAFYKTSFYRTDLDATRRWFVQLGWMVPTFVGLSSFQAMAEEDSRGLLQYIDIPVAYFAGRHDLIWDPRWSEEAHKLTPNSTLRFFENSGHVAFVENRIEWSGALRELLLEDLKD